MFQTNKLQAMLAPLSGTVWSWCRLNKNKRNTPEVSMMDVAGVMIMGWEKTMSASEKIESPLWPPRS